MSLLETWLAIYLVGALLCMVLCSVVSDWSARDVVLFAAIWPIVLAVVVATAAIGLCEAVGRVLQRLRVLR